jgi:hypothetical protein
MPCSKYNVLYHCPGAVLLHLNWWIKRGNESFLPSIKMNDPLKKTLTGLFKKY